MSRSDQPSNKLLHLKGVHGVGELILTSGPIVPTQDANKLYSNIKGLHTRKSSIDFYEIMTKFLNISQTYISGRGFLMENTGIKVQQLIDTIATTVNEDIVVNGRISDRLTDKFRSMLNYLDTPRDRLLLKGLMAEITSVKFTT